MHYRLLALDVLGTILENAKRPFSSAGSGDSRTAAWPTRGSGTGRRFRTACPLAQALQLDGPLVVHNGALVKTRAPARHCSHPTSQPRCITPALALLRRLSTPMVCVDAFMRTSISSPSLCGTRAPFSAHTSRTSRSPPYRDDIASPQVHGVSW
jgi:hypothetical protein